MTLSSPKDVTSDKTMYGYNSQAAPFRIPWNAAQNISRVAIRIFGFVIVTIIRLLLFEYVPENNDDELCAHWHALAPHKCIYASDAFQ